MASFKVTYTTLNQNTWELDIEEKSFRSSKARTEFVQAAKEEDAMFAVILYNPPEKRASAFDDYDVPETVIMDEIEKALKEDGHENE